MGKIISGNYKEMILSEETRVKLLNYCAYLIIFISGEFMAGNFFAGYFLAYAVTFGILWLKTFWPETFWAETMTNISAYKYESHMRLR